MKIAYGHIDGLDTCPLDALHGAALLADQIARYARSTEASMGVTLIVIGTAHIVLTARARSGTALTLSIIATSALALDICATLLAVPSAPFHVADRMTASVEGVAEVSRSTSVDSKITTARLVEAP